MKEKINIGIVGAAGRGKSFNRVCVSSNVFKIHAVCDINKEKLEQARVESGAVEKYSDYEEMLEKSVERAKANFRRTLFKRDL